MLTMLVMGVLVEATNETIPHRTQRIWELMTDLYACHEALFQLAEDRRRKEAATHIVKAWKARASKWQAGTCPPKPEFVKKLEARLADMQKAAPSIPSTSTVQNNGEYQISQPSAPVAPAGVDFSDIFELDFENIDWSFWASID
jgi:hypothetical protein